MAWLVDNVGTILTLLVLALIVFLALRPISLTVFSPGWACRERPSAQC